MLRSDVLRYECYADQMCRDRTDVELRCAEICQVLRSDVLRYEKC